MDPSKEQSRSNCEQTWKAALETCREVLGEDDYDLIVDFENPDKAITAIKGLEDRYAQSPVSRVLKNIKPQLARLHKFDQTLRNITTKVDHLQKLLEAQNITQLNRTQARLAQSLSQLNVNGSGGPQQPDMNTLSVNTLPHQRNPTFYGRKELIREINSYLHAREGDPLIRSVAIWGTGGIGKSQIALEYAQQQWLAGTNVILWVASETEAEIAKSFNEAASRLDLPGYLETNTPDQNRFAVLQWLQRSGSVPWLLILDNVEDQKVLSENWPRTGNGSILVTCRSEILAASPAAVAIEIPAFTMSESGELIMNIMNRKNASEDENLAAHELSEKLGGLALAIDIVAKQIKTRKRFKTIRDFLPYYEQHYRTLHKRPKIGIFDPYYSKDIDTVWQTAFEHLEPDAARLMSLFCFMAPEGIPQWVLEPKGDVPTGWEFLKDPENFDKVKVELLDLSLIRINEETGLISLHRLTQQAFFDRMSEQERKDAFKVAFALLREAFPGRQGRSVRAIPKAKKALRIREASATDKNDLANGFSDVGYSSVAAYEAEQGLQYLEKALGIAEAAPEPDRYKVYNIDRFLRNHGRGNMLLGRYDEAKADFDKAEYYQPMIHGKNSHYDGE
ncbi:MAG: hypothetical protein Q9207_007903 [Kuettlingeria erythrocarpa]